MKKNIKLKLSDDEIKIFTYKGTTILFAFLIFGTLIFPFFLQAIGIEYKKSIILSTTLFGGFGVAYVRHFIETKKRFAKSFYVQMIIFGLIFYVIAYSWLVLNLYI